MIAAWKLIHRAFGGAGSIEAGDEFDPCALVTEIGAAFAGDARRRGITLAAAVRAGVPHRVRADRLRLDAALALLVAEALRSGPRGAIVLDVAALGRDGDEVSLAFSVAGTSVVPLPSGADARRCRALVRAMGGRLALAARPGGGWALTFTVASRRAAEPAPDAAVALDRRVMVWSELGAARAELGALLEIPGMRVDVHADLGSAAKALGAAARYGMPFQTFIVVVDPGDERADLEAAALVCPQAPAALELVLVARSNDEALRARAARAGYRHVVSDLAGAGLVAVRAARAGAPYPACAGGASG